MSTYISVSFSSINFSNNLRLMRGLVPFHKIKDAVSFASIICLTFLSLIPTYSAVSCTDKVYFSHHGICIASLLIAVFPCSSVASIINHSNSQNILYIIALPNTAMLRYFITNNPKSIFTFQIINTIP